MVVGQLVKNGWVFQCRGVLCDRLVLGQAAQQAAHDLAGAGLGQVLTKADVFGFGDGANLFATLDKIATKLGRPDSMKFQQHYEDIMGDPDVHRAMTSRDGRAAVTALMKDLHDQHEAYVSGWNQIGKNYGWSGDPTSLPQMSNGSVDWKKALKEHFNPALEKANNEAVRKFRETQQQASQLGYGAIQMPDGTTKLVKNEDVGAAMGKKPVASTPLPSETPSATSERPPLDSFQTE